MARKGFASGKITAPDEYGYSKMSLSVVDQNTGDAYHYSQKAVTRSAMYPHSIRSFVINIAFESIISQFRSRNGL